MTKQLPNSRNLLTNRKPASSRRGGGDAMSSLVEVIWNVRRTWGRST